jgi:GrpB-like predicted nucleotidyltransferase (UPF0157 family)
MNDIFHIAEVPPALLQAERKRLLDLLRGHIPLKFVYEVGSTAILGIVGKQDLDFLVLVPTADFGATRAKLDQLFSRNPNQLSSEVYQGYTVESELDVAIQLTIANGPHDTFLAFLSELRKNVGLRTQYNQLKYAFDGKPMAEYREAKSAFIERVLSNQHR